MFSDAFFFFGHTRSEEACFTLSRDMEIKYTIKIHGLNSELTTQNEIAGENACVNSINYCAQNFSCVKRINA